MQNATHARQGTMRRTRLDAAHIHTAPDLLGDGDRTYGSLRIGPEVEAWVTDRNGDPIPLWDRLADGTLVPHGSIAHEPGVGSIEYTAAPAATPDGVVGHIIKAAQHTLCSHDEQWQVHLVPNAPFSVLNDVPGPHVPRELKSRYHALWDALKKEACTRGCPDAWHGVERMKTHAACQLNIGGIPAREFMTVYNVLHYTAPYRRRAICRRYGLADPGGLAMWGMHGTGQESWAHPDRFTQPHRRWFPNVECYAACFEALPLLLQSTGNGADAWGVAPDGERPSFGRADHESNAWWDVRIRGTHQQSPAEWYVEDRVYPVAPLPVLRHIVADVFHLVACIIDECPYSPPATPADARTLLSRLNQASYLVPPPVGAGTEPYPAGNWLNDRIA